MPGPSSPPQLTELPRSEERNDVDDDSRAWAVHDGVAVDHTALVTVGERNYLPLDHDGERLHLPFPAGRQVTGSVKFLRQSRRQAAIPRRVVLINDSYVARFEIATLGTMVELTIIGPKPVRLTGHLKRWRK